MDVHCSAYGEPWDSWHIIHCPACPPKAKANQDRLTLKHAIEDMLGDDLDAIAATFNDHHL